MCNVVNLCQVGVSLCRNSFLLEYVGEVLDYREFKKRTKKYDTEDKVHHYFMALNADQIIDATRKGSISRFINHSCDPNSETQKVCPTSLLVTLKKGSTRDCVAQ